MPNNDWSVAGDERLKEFCGGDQAEKLDRIIKCKGFIQADREAGISSGKHSKALNLVIAKAARRGYAPNHWTQGVAEGYGMGKVTIQRDGAGEIIQTWERQLPLEMAEELKEVVEGLKEDLPKFTPKKKVKGKKRDDLLPSIFIGDAHIGMRAFGKETKHRDFDTDIAVKELRDSIDYLVDRAEPSVNGLLVDVGDYTHSNGHNDTTFSGTPLDVDTRHRSTLYQAAMTMRYSIDRMLEKVDNLYVIIAKGNHNTDVAPAIELMLQFCYEKEPRVNVLGTNGDYHYFEYGKWLFGVTHGNKQNAERLAGSMARDMSEAWGRTTHRMWCTGHFHKEAVKTLAGVKHKVFAALPPPDAWHASHGFSGDGEMEMMTFRKQGGVHSSHVYNIPRPIIEPDVRIK